MNALNAQNLENTLKLQEKVDDVQEKDWKKINLTACVIIISCLIQNLKYHVINETSAERIWEILESK